MFTRFLSCLLLCIAPVTPGWAAETQTQAVLLVTIDGLRWQELFYGVDQRLMNRDSGGVRDLETLERRYWHEDSQQRRRQLMPFFWETIAPQGQVFGHPASNSSATVTNGKYFSYPGYNEILCGFGDPEINSNDKIPNRNLSVLEWLHQQPGYQGKILGVTTWDVFPFILNSQRSGIPVHAAWESVQILPDSQPLLAVKQMASELPHMWPGVCYDIFTFHVALHLMNEHRPRVMYVAFGETDDWAHEGRYDLYLEAARRNDQYIQTLWETAQSLPEYAGKTSLVLTTDHGRGDTRDGWKSHGVDYPGSDRIWIAVLGPDTPAHGIRRDIDVTQGQVAATVAALLGHDFTSAVPQAAKPLPDVVR